MDVAVIGGGPGGYVCAIRLAKLQANVTLIEEDNLGGTCLNRGCIPTKALLHVAKDYRKLRNIDDVGIDVREYKLDLNKTHQYKEKIIKRLHIGIKSLFSANGIELIKGRAKLNGGKTVSIQTEEGELIRRFDKIVLATGSSPFVPPINGSDCDGVVTSDEALNFIEVPDRLAIIGGGVIGCEFADVYKGFGSRVTIIEALPSVLSNLDEDIINAYSKKLKSDGIDIYVDSKIESIEKGDDGLKVSFVKDGTENSVLVDKVLIATGRRPNTASLGLEEENIKTDRGYVLVDKDTMITSNEDIYAIGDIVPGLQLAHVASAEGIICANSIMGCDEKINLSTIPSIVYVDPEIASVGMSEKQLKSSGKEYKVGSFPIIGNGRAMIEGTRHGFIKVIADMDDTILGVHMMCPYASEIISEAALAVGNKMKAKDIDSIIHAHPTVNEALHEAILDLDDNAIHKA